MLDTSSIFLQIYSLLTTTEFVSAFDRDLTHRAPLVRPFRILMVVFSYYYSSYHY